MAEHSQRFVALLRGINVGGKNIIAKDDLRRCFEDCGLTSVRTYIQSGNILFRSEGGNSKTLTATLEEALSERFTYDARAVVWSSQKYKKMMRNLPSSWGREANQKHNALFTLNSTTVKKVLAELPPPKPEFEKVTTLPGVLLWSASKEHLGKTTIVQMAKRPIYRELTVRNHKTVHKLSEMLDQI